MTPPPPQGAPWYDIYVVGIGTVTLSSQSEQRTDGYRSTIIGSIFCKPSSRCCCCHCCLGALAKLATHIPPNFVTSCRDRCHLAVATQIPCVRTGNLVLHLLWPKGRRVRFCLAGLIRPRFTACLVPLPVLLEACGQRYNSSFWSMRPAWKMEILGRRVCKGLDVNKPPPPATATMNSHAPAGRCDVKRPVGAIHCSDCNVCVTKVCVCHVSYARSSLLLLRMR